MTDRRLDIAAGGVRNGLRAMLVVRDPIDARILNDFISSCGFAVTMQDDPVTALTRCKETPPALVLVDHELIGTSGIAFLRALLKVSWTTATILISLEDDERVHDLAEGLGILGSIDGYHDLEAAAALVDKFRELEALHAGTRSK